MTHAKPLTDAEVLRLYRRNTPSPEPMSDMDVLAFIYDRRQSRDIHPRGAFDKAGRWYPSDEETASCCGHVRSPSRTHPYSYMVHCRTRKHLNTWYLEHVCAPLFRDLMALCAGEDR